jgi:drug/metabolite transporter (DMT)-like permease
MFSPIALSFIALHFTVFLWGFTAILGKLISYGSFTLVWHRMTIAFFVYLLIPSTYQELKKLNYNQVRAFCGIGIIVCMHWVSFYGSIKLGDSASITLACLGAVSFFSSILEPCILGSPYSKKDIMLGMVVVVGVLFIYYSLPNESSQVSYGWAIVVGLISAFLASLFTVLNKKYIEQAPPLAISAIEMGAGSLCLSILVPIMYRKETQWTPNIEVHHLSAETLRTGSWDLIWVLILSLLCTNLTFYLSVFSLKNLSAFTINLTCNLEPVYGIVLGAIFFHENKSLNYEFYLGTSIILVAIFANPILDHYKLSVTPLDPIAAAEGSSVMMGRLPEDRRPQGAIDEPDNDNNSSQEDHHLLSRDPDTQLDDIESL